MFGKKKLRHEFELYKQITSKELEGAYEYVIELNHRLTTLEEWVKGLDSKLCEQEKVLLERFRINGSQPAFDESKMLTKDGMYSYKAFKNRTSTGKGVDEE